MTKIEFVKAIAYLTSACGHVLSEDRLAVYFDLLGDLTYEAFLATCQRVAIEHKFPTFPSIAELREAAVLAVRGEVRELSAPEAWSIAWGIVKATDPEIDGSFHRAAKDAPQIVVDTITAFGLLDLCYSDSPIGVLRSQWMKTYEAIAARQKRTAILPPKVLRELEHRQAAAKTLAIAGWEPEKP